MKSIVKTAVMGAFIGALVGLILLWILPESVSDHQEVLFFALVFAVIYPLVDWLVKKRKTKKEIVR
jgi:Na+-translocating ferredoxin:NAD+ oxidoreductase RnfD subunit